MTCTVTEDDVDVFLSGFAFRLKILHERGLSLVKRESKKLDIDLSLFLCYSDLSSGANLI